MRWRSIGRAATCLLIQRASRWVPTSLPWWMATDQTHHSRRGKLSWRLQQQCRIAIATLLHSTHLIITYTDTIRRSMPTITMEMMTTMMFPWIPAISPVPTLMASTLTWCKGFFCNSGRCVAWGMEDRWPPSTDWTCVYVILTYRQWRPSHSSYAWPLKHPISSQARPSIKSWIRSCDSVIHIGVGKTSALIHTKAKKVFLSARLLYFR